MITTGLENVIGSLQYIEVGCLHPNLSFRKLGTDMKAANSAQHGKYGPFIRCRSLDPLMTCVVIHFDYSILYTAQCFLTCI
jgi:hypothetical protein